MTIRDFLRQYAKRFPDKINFGDTEKFIEKTNMITFDYADGLITFFEHKVSDSILDDIYVVTGSGGNNGCMLNEPEHQFVWATLLEHEPKFMNFYKEHFFAVEEFMNIIISWENNDEEIGNQDIECKFTFYEGKDY